MGITINNPILPGFYPDPSICRVEDDYYMVTSSFSYFPGVPIFHSRDLAHWEQIGHVLDRPEQLALTPDAISGGIYAPTLRYHNGLFYMITTNVLDKGNFIVTAENPKGPWSDPHWIEGAEGIDPSLFWDDDGKAYYTGTGEADHVPHIWISEIDLIDFCLVGEKRILWGGSLSQPRCPEGPHLYKIGGYYYLMTAEGGTEHYHSETIARSEHLMGPYTSFPGNPILTMRHFGIHAPIANTGHADLVQCQDGSWWMVFLASRPYGGYHKNLGRETFLAPVEWLDGWPLVSPATGKIMFSYEGPNLSEVPTAPVPARDDFDGDSLSYVWNYLGTPAKDTVKIEDSCAKIKLYRHPMGPEAIAQDCNAPHRIGFLGRRQQHMSFTASAKLLFEPKDHQSAGLVILQNGFQQLRVEYTNNESGNPVVRLVKGYMRLEGSLVYRKDEKTFTEEILAEIPWEGAETIFTIQAREQNFSFFASTQDKEKTFLGETDGGFLGSETAGGFVGAYIGMFATGNGTDYEEYAAFDWFSYDSYA
jgi:alpha-N-arabinofuranosidase